MRRRAIHDDSYYNDGNALPLAIKSDESNNFNFFSSSISFMYLLSRSADN